MFTHIRRHTHIRIHIHIRMHVHAHVYVHTHVHAYTHECTCEYSTQTITHSLHDPQFSLPFGLFRHRAWDCWIPGPVSQQTIKPTTNKQIIQEASMPTK